VAAIAVVDSTLFGIGFYLMKLEHGGKERFGGEKAKPLMARGI